MLFCGFIAARIGHGMTIVVALGLITIGLALSGCAGSVPVLGLGMLFIGAGAGVYPPSGIAMINTKISVDRRSTAFAMHEIGPNLSLLLAPLMVLLIEPWFGWRGVLFALAGICGLSTFAFFRWGTMDSGVGAAPDLSTIGKILKMRTTYVGMLTFSAALAGLHGVYAILPAYLVTEYELSPQYVNILLTVSRISSVLILFWAGPIIGYLGKRRTMILILLFTGLFTGLIGVVEGGMVPVVVIAQPALLVVMIPAMLSSVADIGESRYQNITYALIITVGVSFGGGLVPALLGLFGDHGLGWLGFISLAGFMASTILCLLVTPGFGREQTDPVTGQ
jgi:NNP family nitrate/nitrite transporter-like MFS transporter